MPPSDWIKVDETWLIPNIRNGHFAHRWKVSYYPDGQLRELQELDSSGQLVVVMRLSPGKPEAEVVTPSMRHTYRNGIADTLDSPFESPAKKERFEDWVRSMLKHIGAGPS